MEMQSNDFTIGVVNASGEIFISQHSPSDPCIYLHPERIPLVIEWLLKARAILDEIDLVNGG